MSVGSRIKELRENKQLSRNELSELLGVTVGAISNYENGVSSPKEPILFKLMEVLHCDANYLFQDSIEMPSMKNNVSLNEYEIIKKYRSLDSHGKEMVDFTLEKEWERSTSVEPKLNIPLHLVPNAAHERPGATYDEKKHDDDIMNDEDF